MQVRRGRLVLGAACLVFALLVAGIWIVPAMLDWNRYRDGIAALASQRLGRPVHIGGGVSLQLLPQPILTADDVLVEAGLADEHGQAIGADAIGLRAKALRLRVALGSLLAGKIDVRELTLQGADLRLPWPPPPGALAQRPPAWLTGLRARIEDGRMQVGELVFTGIQGTVTTDPETGTLAAAGMWDAARPGTGDAKETPRRWQFTARLGRPGRDGSATLDASLDGQDRLRNTGGTFSGQIAADGAMSGRVAGRGPDLSLLMPAPAMPWRGDGRLNAAGGLAIADELALEIGGAPARGAVALRVQPVAQLDVAITAGRLDLDAWLPALLARNPGTLRAGIPTGVDLSAEAATLAGGTVRQLRGAVDLDRGVVRLRDVTAILPGDAHLGLTGEVATEAQARFDGTVALQAPDLRTTLRWLQRVLAPAMADLPPGVLHTANLSARVKADLGADSGQASVTELKGRVDESAVAGSVALKWGARPGVTAALTLDRLDLDPWLPSPRTVKPASLETALARLRSMDGGLKLQLGQATWRGMSLGTVAMELQSEAARVALRRLDAQPLGGTLSLSGQLGEGGRLSDGRLDLAAEDVGLFRGVLLELAPSLLAVEKLLQGPATLLVLAAGPPDALGGRATLDLGDLRLEAQPVVNLVARHWTGPLTLHHPGAPRLLETIGLPGTAAWLGDGSLSLVGQADVTPGRFEMDGATLAAGSLRATGRVVLEGRQLLGAVGFEVLPLPLPHPHSPEPLRVPWLRDWMAALRVEAAEVQVGQMPVLHAASADVTLQDGVLTLARVAGQLGGGMLSGSMRLDAASDPPQLAVQVQGNGVVLPGPVFETPLDVVSGHLDGNGSLSAAGYSPAALLATLAGSATVRVHDGLVAGFDLTAAGLAVAMPDAGRAAAAARTALLAGNTSFGTLAVPLTIDRGVVAGDATLTSQAGTGRLAGSVDLQNGSLDLRLTLQPMASMPDARAGGPGEPITATESSNPGSPSLGLRVTGQPEAPARTPELAGLARWLADRAP